MQDYDQVYIILSDLIKMKVIHFFTVRGFTGWPVT